MKKFIKLVLCLCLCVVAISFGACWKSKLECPESDSAVKSNGGCVVQKGDYLYFTNGYSSLESITKSNATKKYTHGGLYFAKLNQDGEIESEENGNTKGIKRLSSKLAGFEASDLQIFGDYMYFTSVNTDENKSGELQTTHLEIYRIKLNGTGLKRVYRSGIDFEDDEGERQVKFNFFENEGSVYILIQEQKELKRIKCTAKSIGKAEVVASEFESIVINNGTTDQVFYLTTSDDAYEINRYDVVKNKVITKLACDRDWQIDSLFEVKFNNLYLYATATGSSSYLYKLSIADFEARSFNLTKLTAGEYTVYLLDSESDGILLVGESKVEIAVFGKSLSDVDYLDLQENFDQDATIMTIKAGYVYYYKDKAIKRWNYLTDSEETIVNEENTICNYSFDIVGNYIYYFATTGSNDYLYRVNIATSSEDKKPQLVGEYLEEDIPEAEEEEEESE